MIEESGELRAKRRHRREKGERARERLPKSENGTASTSSIFLS